MSAPESQDKKVPHFSSLKFTPAAQPAESCCADPACSSETAAENDALSHARFSWLVEGMDCAACARKVETAVRQCRGQPVQVLFATEKLLVNAEGNVHPQIESAVRAAGYQLRDENAPRAEEPTSWLRENLPLLTLVAMMALSWGWSSSARLWAKSPSSQPRWSACGRSPGKQYA